MWLRGGVIFHGPASWEVVKVDQRRRPGGQPTASGRNHVVFPPQENTAGVPFPDCLEWGTLTYSSFPPPMTNSSCLCVWVAGEEAGWCLAHGPRGWLPVMKASMWPRDGSLGTWGPLFLVSAPPGPAVACRDCCWGKSHRKIKARGSCLGASRARPSASPCICAPCLEASSSKGGG